MADNAREMAATSRIRFTEGLPVGGALEDLEREMRWRDREGVAQIERVMRGEELPGANPKDVRAAMLRDLGIAPPRRGPGQQLRVDPGSVVGHPTIDERAVDKVMGRAIYSSDIYLPGMLFTKVLRSPHPHARVTSIDVSQAEALPGVHGVITFEDVPAAGRPALTGEPAFQGDPIAAVAAETEAIAEEAVNLIQIQYEMLPFVIDAREAARPGAALVRSNLESNHVRDPQYLYERGDPDAGVAEAEVTAEVTVDTSWEQHVAMEPHNAVAEWDGDELTIYAGNQWPHGIVNSVSRELGIPASKVRVLAGDTGGGWGDKTGRHTYHVITALLAKKTGRPVRYELNRKDIFLDSGHNYPMHGTASFGLRRDGRITALTGTSYVASGAYGARANSDDWESVLRTYQIPNVRVNGFALATNTVIGSPLRAVGEPAGVFMAENLANRAAQALDMDPLEFRLLNIETEMDQVAELPYSSNGLREAIERGAELFGWRDRWQGWNRQRSLDGPQRGIGMMCFTCNKGSAGGPMTAIVQIQGDGSIVVNTGAADIGGGQRTTWRMIVAETLGVPLETVTINAMDSRAGPDSLGIFGSRGTKSVGNGMLHAALDAKRKLLLGIAGEWEAPIEDLDIKDGVIFRLSDPDNEEFQMTVREAVGSAVIIVDDIPRPASGTIVGEARVPPFSGYAQKTFGAGFYEVEVDPATGFVRVIEAVQVHDVGRAINPTGVLNQIEGGMMQGINKALTEELVYDPPTGAVVNPNLDEYKLHMIDGLPEKVAIDFVEPFDVIGPYGAKGIGEPALLPPAPAIHAAIYDAVGAYVNYQPMTPSRVLNAIRAL